MGARVKGEAMETRAKVVAVVDDPGERREALCRALRRARCATVAIPYDDITTAMIDRLDPDVVVSPLARDPEDLVPTLRQENARPIVLLAVDESPWDWRVAAKRMGVDSIIDLPDELDRVADRVGELSRIVPSSSLIRVADLTIDELAHVVCRGETELELTATEYRLLVDLAKNAGTVMSKSQLLDRVWGFDDYDPNVVEVHVSTLRRKLEAHGPRLIHTIRSFGYVLRPARLVSVAAAS
jgi:DNA-binding response OmpR family regulator